MNSEPIDQQLPQGVAIYYDIVYDSLRCSEVKSNFIVMVFLLMFFFVSARSIF